MSNLLKFFLFIIIIIFSISIFAQTGTLKIFSEIDSINVYLDDVYHGNGKSPIESIPVGSHYLKLLKNDIIIFSELVNISDNVVTSILLKDTPGIRKKLLEGLSAEIKSYNAEKITLNIEMVNNQPSSWFLIQNNNIITQKNFAEIIGDNSILEKVNKSNNIATILRCVGAPFVIGGGFLYVLSFIKMIQEEPLYPGASSSFGAGWFNIIVLGAVPLAIGITLIKVSNQSNSYMTLDYAIEKVKEYNNKLKIKWGLPLDFEE